MSEDSTRDRIEQRFPDFPKPEQVSGFYEQLGRTIATWQLVEANLYEVYRACTASQRPAAEAAAFFAIGTFRTQLNLVDAAVKIVLYDDKERLEKWKSLLNLATKKSKKRNNLAHGMVYLQYLEKKTERKIFIGPHASDPRPHFEMKKQQDQPLSQSLVADYEKAFRLLAKDLRDFAFDSLPPV